VSATLNITVTASPPPTSLTLSGPTSLQNAGTATATATALYKDGTTRSVTPSWTSDNTTAATVSATGVITAGTVSADTVVTLTASLTESGVTVSATLRVTIAAARATLTSLRVSGASSMQSGGQLLLATSAIYSDGSSRPAAGVSYTLSNPALGTVNNRNILSVATVTSDTALTVTASYTEDGVTKTGSLSLTITAAPAKLTRLTIIGARGTLAAGESLNLSTEGVYADASRKAVTSSWQVSGNAATIVSSTGVLTANPVATETSALVTASYTEAGVTVTAQYLVLVQAQELPSPLQAEVQVTGTSTNLGLVVWANINASSPLSAPAGSSRVRGTVKPAADRPVYRVYVAALVPGGALLPSPTIFVLNRSRTWQGVSFPVAEYLSGVADNSVQLIEIFDQLDVSIISGTKIFIGYGITDTEMIESGRFRMVYQVQ
jgi:hypothetical protein